MTYGQIIAAIQCYIHHRTGKEVHKKDATDV